MISIIIASANPQLLQNVKANIDETIGVPYEVLAFENGDGAKGICDLYNEGIRKAKHDILCFMHEDIKFVTNKWGGLVWDAFQQHTKVGIIGIAGSTFKSIMPIGWPSQGSHETERCHLLQSSKYTKKDTFHAYLNPQKEQLSRVVVVDGVWMCVRKKVTEEFLFDSNTFKNFHCYDIDFCLSAGTSFEIAVIYNVLLHHFSEGNIDRAWMEQSLLLYDKWEDTLPKSTIPLSKRRIRKIEKQNFRYWLKQIHVFGFDKKLAFRLLHRHKLIKILGLKYFLKFHYSILNEYYFKRNL